jgi:hypothetical protein
MRYFKSKHRLPDKFSQSLCAYCEQAWPCPGYAEDFDAYELAAEMEIDRRREEPNDPS